MKVNRTRFLISVIVIFQLMWLIVTFGLNGHFHQLGNHRIIYHSHPMSAGENHGGGWPQHHHFALQLVYYSQLNHLLTDGWGIIVAILLFTVVVVRLTIIVFPRKNNTPGMLLSARAPPVILVENYK
ncbi:hypothetical protein KAH55_14210 [bacterium]|nr:hypothetical protein [bacterium]